MDTPATPPDHKPTLEQLLRRGDVWRGHSQAFTPQEAVTTGHAGLDAKLVSRGWPRGGLVEICLPGASGIRAGFGGEWLLLAPAVRAACDAGSLTVLLDPPAEPLASGLIQLDLPLDRLLVVRTGNKADFIASFVELSRSRHCTLLLAWQPERNLSYTELRKCQLACADQHGLYFLLRSHKHKKQSSPAPLRVLLRLQPDALDVEIFKQKGRFHPGMAHIPVPQNWLPRVAHRELGGAVFSPTTRPLTHVAALANKPHLENRPNIVRPNSVGPNIVPIRSKLKRKYY